MVVLEKESVVASTWCNTYCEGVLNREEGAGCGAAAILVWWDVNDSSIGALVSLHTTDVGDETLRVQRGLGRCRTDTAVAGMAKGGLATSWAPGGWSRRVRALSFDAFLGVRCK